MKAKWIVVTAMLLSSAPSFAVYSMSENYCDPGGTWRAPGENFRDFSDHHYRGDPVARNIF